MNYFDSECSRRRWLARSTVAAAGLWVHRGTTAAVDPAASAALAETRFAAMARPALPVRHPEKSVLLSAALARGRVVAVGERGVVALSDDLGKSWHQAQHVPTSMTLTAVRFVDAQKGFAVGHGGVVLATADGGERWAIRCDGRTLAKLAVVAADQRASVGDIKATRWQKEAALLTADGPDKPLLDLYFADAQRGVVVGAYNLFYETNDGGQSWSAGLDRLDNPKARHLYAVRGRGNTWIVAGEQGLLLRSRDAGRTFERLASPYDGSWFTLASTPQGGWVVAGLRGHAYYSGDDGETWALIGGATPASFVSLAPLDNGSVLLANQAGQLFASKAGAPMVRIAAPALPPLSQVLPLSNGDLLALGFAGATRIAGGKT